MFAKRVHVGGDVILNKDLFEKGNVTGALESFVSLENALIGGRLVFGGKPNHEMYNGEEDTQPFLNVDFAKIAGSMSLTIDTSSVNPPAGSADNWASVNQSGLTPAEQLNGTPAKTIHKSPVAKSKACRVSLRSASAGRIDIHECNHDHVEWSLEGLTYNAVDQYWLCRGDNTQVGIDVWITKILSKSIQPYDQFIAFLKACRDETGAWQTGIAKENVITDTLNANRPHYSSASDRTRRAAAPSPLRPNLFMRLQNVAERGALPLYMWWRRFVGPYTVNYGYNPLLAICWLLALWIFGVFVFSLADGRIYGNVHFMFPTKAVYYEGYVHKLGDLFKCKDKDNKDVNCVAPENYPAFNPWLYSLELATPMPGLGQGEHWGVEGGHGWLGFCLTVYRWLHMIVGWVLSFLIVLSPTKLLRRV